MLGPELGQSATEEVVPANMVLFMDKSIKLRRKVTGVEMLPIQEAFKSLGHYVKENGVSVTFPEFVSNSLLHSSPPKLGLNMVASVKVLCCLIVTLAMGASMVVFGVILMNSFPNR